MADWDRSRRWTVYQSFAPTEQLNAVRQPTYLFVDEASGEALVIDDLEEARRVALEMIAAGAPVVRFDND